MSGTALRRWPWLESGLIPLASASMRVAWLTPLLYFVLNNPFVAPRGVHYPAWLILAFLLGASALESALRDHPNGPSLAAAGGIAAILVALAVTLRLDVAHPGLWLRRVGVNLTDFSQAFPATLVVILATTLIWRRGMTANWHSYMELFRGFTVGVSVLGFLLLVSSGESWERAGISIWGSTLSFIVSALLSLALIGAYDVLHVEQLGEGHVPTLSRPWVVAALVVVAGVIVAGWLAAVLVSPGTLREVLRLLAPIWSVIRDAIMYVWLAFAYVIFWLLGPLLELLQARVSENWEEATERLAERLEEQMELPEPTPAAPNPALQMALRILFITVLVLGIVLAFYMAFRRRSRQRRRRGILEERESVLSRDLLMQQLRDLFSRRREEEPSPFLALTGEDPRQAIRRLYQRLLSRMSALGRARSPALTPRAYAHSLSDLLPSESQALETLTEAYLVARYADVAPTQQDVQEASRAWERIRARVGGS